MPGPQDAPEPQQVVAAGITDEQIKTGIGHLVLQLWMAQGEGARLAAELATERAKAKQQEP